MTLNQNNVDHTDTVIALLEIALDLSLRGCSDSELPKHLKTLVYALTDPQFSDQLGIEDAFPERMVVADLPDRPKTNPIRELLKITKDLASDCGREVLAQDLSEMLTALSGTDDDDDF